MESHASRGYDTLTATVTFRLEGGYTLTTINEMIAKIAKLIESHSDTVLESIEITPTETY